jgi:hypothetical protein
MVPRNYILGASRQFRGEPHTASHEQNRPHRQAHGDPHGLIAGLNGKNACRAPSGFRDAHSHSLSGRAMRRSSGMGKCSQRTELKLPIYRHAKTKLPTQFPQLALGYARCAGGNFNVQKLWRAATKRLSRIHVAACGADADHDRADRRGDTPASLVTRRSVMPRSHLPRRRNRSRADLPAVAMRAR